MIPELKTFLLATSPIIELRGAIPLALTVYKLPAWSAYLFSVLGNLVPLILIILLLEPFSRFLSAKIPFFQKFFNWLYQHTRQSSQAKTEKWGRSLTVVLIVATPIPFIGGWTGAILASVLGMPFKQALLLVIAGCLLSGLIVLLPTLIALNLV